MVRSGANKKDVERNNSTTPVAMETLWSDKLTIVALLSDYINIDIKV